MRPSNVIKRLPAFYRGKTPNTSTGIYKWMGKWGINMDQGENI